MSGLLGAFGFSGSSPKPISNNNKSSSGGLFGLGGSHKKPGFINVKNTELPYKSVVAFDKYKEHSNLKFANAFGNEKEYRVNNGKEKFHVKNIRGLMKEAAIYTIKTKEQPNVEAIKNFLVEKKKFKIEDAKQIATLYGRMIYQPTDTGRTPEQIQRLVSLARRSGEMADGQSHNLGDSLAVNRQKGSKNSMKSFQNETSVRLNMMDTGKTIHGTSALSPDDKTDTNEIRRSGGIKYTEKGKVSIIDTGEARNVVETPDAKGITGGNVVSLSEKRAAKQSFDKSIPLSKAA